MGSIVQIRAGLKTRLATIANLHAYEKVPDAIATPAGIVGQPIIDYDLTMQDGADTITIPVRILVQNGDLEKAQVELDDYLARTTAQSPKSIKSAIEADPALGGAANTLTVRRAHNYGFFRYGDQEYPGVDFEIEVIA